MGTSHNLSMSGGFALTRSRKKKTNSRSCGTCFNLCLINSSDNGENPTNAIHSETARRTKNT